MPLTISPQVLEKLGNKNPAVTRREVEQCFDNRAGEILFDEREREIRLIRQRNGLSRRQTKIEI